MPSFYKKLSVLVYLLLYSCMVKAQADCDSIFLTNGIKFIGSLQSRDGSLITLNIVNLIFFKLLLLDYMNAQEERMISFI